MAQSERLVLSQKIHRMIGKVREDTVDAGLEIEDIQEIFQVCRIGWQGFLFSTESTRVHHETRFVRLLDNV